MSNFLKPIFATRSARYPRPVPSGFTLVELLVVIVLIAVLAGLLMPGVQSAFRKGRSTKCLAQMRQLGSAALLFAADNSMTLPVTTHQRTSGGKSWSLSLQPYAGGKLVFKCPDDEVLARTYTYVLNDFLTPNPAGAEDLDFSQLSKLDRPSETVLFAEASKTYTGSDHFHFADYRGLTMPASALAQQVAVERHAGSANYVYADGHAENVAWTRAQELLRQNESRFVDPTK